MAVYNVYAAALRGIGNSRAPFFAVLVSSLVNVGLDLFWSPSFIGALQEPQLPPSSPKLP